MTYEVITGHEKSKARKFGKRMKSRAVRKNNKRLCTLILQGDLDRADSITVDNPQGWLV